MRIFIVLGSVNIAARLFKYIKKAGIGGCSLVKTPVLISSGGCSYSILTEENNTGLIEKEAQKRRIRIKGIYKEVLKEGEVSYVSLS